MELTINQKCPSCGAAITLQEDDTLIHCEYCDVGNYKVANQADRFFLAPSRLPEKILPQDVYYVPYIRFKGTIFFVEGEEVRHKLVDTTRLAVKSTRFPVSLGIRPQTVSLYPVVSAVEGQFLLQSEPTRRIFGDAVKTIDLFRLKSGLKKPRIFHRAFIGETLSRIYQPYYVLSGKVYDAVLNRKVGPEEMLLEIVDGSSASQKNWEPRFITTLCPGCGGLLSGERDSLVLQCTNCLKNWKEENSNFVTVQAHTVASEENGVKYLPFWSISCTVGGPVDLRNFSDYLRFTNQPVVVRKSHESEPLVFLVPAFKVNPRAFLQLCSQLTMWQNKLPDGTERHTREAYPVNLSEKEAIQSIMTVLAATTMAREKRFALLPELVIKETACILKYLPFTRQTHDLIQEHTRASVQTAALRFGRSL